MALGRLKYPYIAVMNGGKLSYGGSQSWAKGTVMKKYGCGVIAGTDMLLYLSLHKDYCIGHELNEKNRNGILEAEDYMETVQKMSWKYFPVIPGFGMPGWLLAGGINRYLRVNRIPLKASFGMFGRNLLSRIQAMLTHDIPVILAVGPNFPLPFRKHKLTFYRKSGEVYEEAAKTAAHYVTVTGMDGKWLRISSWGQEYYVNMTEYMDYVKKHSCFLVSNVCYLRKK